MKKNLLLLLMMISFGALYAQELNRSLIISEIRFFRTNSTYVELTNMSDEPIDLSEYEMVDMTPFVTFPEGAVWPTEPPRNDGRWMFLPHETLGPGESYILGSIFDWQEHAYDDEVALKGYAEVNSPYVTKPEMYQVSDLQVHYDEGGDERDSASIDIPYVSDGDTILQSYQYLLNFWARDAFFIRHHPPGGDSGIVDQFYGTFTDDDGSNIDDFGEIPIAGVDQATTKGILVRRFGVKQGNINFITGTDLSDSEWIPVPHSVAWEGAEDYTRKLFWTVDHHGEVDVDETTLTSSTIDIDWTNMVLKVPWGVRNDDSIMSEFDRTPGLAWHYHYAPTDEDSAYVSVRNGDSLTVYGLGDDLDIKKFAIEALPPTATDNIVIPKRARADGTGLFNWNSTPALVSAGANAGLGWNNGAPYYVSDGLPMDTISEIPYATRVDTLQKYLEKPENATWEIVWVDGVERADVKNGDILRVTSESKAQKDYFLKVNPIRPSSNAYLATVTWPDIPEDYKDIFGWTGDTIPEFGPTRLSYRVTVPWDVDGIPALVARNQDPNGRHETDRATFLNGTLENRTTTITSYAENNKEADKLEYKIVLEKEKERENVQLWAGEPFISQVTKNQNWNNCITEVVNPGNVILDLSDYMLYKGPENDPGAAIASYEDFENRYGKYIPGYMWQTEAEWAVQRAIAIPDAARLGNAVLQPGDVYVMASIYAWHTGAHGDGYYFRDQIDIDFRADPFGDGYSGTNVGGSWGSYNIMLFKILNDSVKLGLKPAIDPNDFELLDYWGHGDGTMALPTKPEDRGYLASYTRKPEIYKGNTVPKGSFFESYDTISGTAGYSEWSLIDEILLISLEYPWPDRRIQVAQGTGSHFMDDVTVYRSTVKSEVYIPSQGFSMAEELRGVVTGTTVDEMFANLIKEDEGQQLMVVNILDSTIIAGDATVMPGHALVVISADSTNMSAYVIDVTDDGLSDDAVLTSTMYTIAVDAAKAEAGTGTIEGMMYGTTLKEVIDNVVVPAGASLRVVDASDNYVPLTRRNFGDEYVDVEVSDEVYFEVVAEDMATMILYQLMPTAEMDAFVTSDVFEVDQVTLLISLIPQGMNVDNFLANLVPSPGATWMLVDKLGIERTDGYVVQDDRLVVTAADGVTSNSYYMTMLGQAANYLAYVTSTFYLVDQEAETIDGVLGTQSVEDFGLRVTLAPGATMTVLDANGTAKAAGEMMAVGDMLYVEAGNGITNRTYSITLDQTGIDNVDDANVRIYPNPNTGQFFISGAEIGNRIRVYNVIGVAVRDVMVYSGIEKISLDDQPGGLYFINISNDKDEIVGHYKVIKH